MTASPHLLTPVVNDLEKALGATSRAEMGVARDGEPTKKSKSRVRNIDGYMSRLAEAKAKARH